MSPPAHTTLSVKQFLTRNGMAFVPHPPYSPILTLVTFFGLFLWMKKFHKGESFADVEEVKQKVAEALKSIKIYEFKHCF